MQAYDVNVRAVIKCRGEDVDVRIGPEWEVYDHDSGEGLTTIRCDTTVTVTADSEEEAIEKAKDDAPAVLDGHFGSADVNLWCDDGIDVILSQAAAPAGP